MKRKVLIGALAVFLVIAGLTVVALVQSPSEGPQTAARTSPSQVREYAPAPLSRSKSDEEASLPALGLGSSGGAAFSSSQVGSPPDRSATGSVTGLPGIGDKVVKTASLEVKVGKDRFQAKWDKALTIAEKLGGHVTSSLVSETKGKIASGIVTMRIPSDKFQLAISELQALGKVTSEEQTGQDVSAEFVDIEARLRHAKSEEVFYLKLMDQAKTVSDLIQIQGQLSQVQLQIEELTGRLEFLKDQTSLSTVTLRLFEPGAASGPRTGLGKAWQEALDAFKRVVSSGVVAIGWISPFVLLGIVTWGVWRVARRRAARPAA